MCSKENTKSTEECIARLADFKEKHFGDKSSPKLLENMLAAERHRSSVIFNELILYKGIVEVMLTKPGVREMFENIEDEELFTNARTVKKGHVRDVMVERLPKSESTNLTLKKLLKAVYDEKDLATLDPVNFHMDSLSYRFKSRSLSARFTGLSSKRYTLS